jgi:hypothetical protein
VFWLIFALLALATGYTVFEAISPTGILSRALIYGPGLALLWVLALLAFEVFVSRRAWCRYACPIGLTYGVVGICLPAAGQVHGWRAVSTRATAARSAWCRMCSTHHQGPRGRHRSAHWPRLHPLRPVRGHLPEPIP